jgi:uncharacterized protein (TIGR02996 family)
MSDEAALLRAISADPDDDTARLVYADWLDENDQPDHAEFIRLQIQQARVAPPGATDPILSEREWTLLRRYAVEWFRPPSGWLIGHNYAVRRGFPCAVICGYEALRDHQDVIARWSLTRYSPGRFLRELGQARLLAESPFLARFRELDLTWTFASREVYRVLLTAPSLAGLQWLNVSGSRLTDEGATSLARPHLPRLRYLDLGDNNITAKGIWALISSEHRGSIEVLDLATNEVPAAAACALLQSDRWTSLTDLSLCATRLGNGGVARIAACPGLSRLSALNLDANSITDVGVRALAASPHARNLHTLALVGNQITSACADALIDSPHLRELKNLRLTNNIIHWRERQKLEEHFGAGVLFG